MSRLRYFVLGLCSAGGVYYSFYSQLNHKYNSGIINEINGMHFKQTLLHTQTDNIGQKESIHFSNLNNNINLDEHAREKRLRSELTRDGLKCGWNDFVRTLHSNIIWVIYQEKL